LWYKLIAGDKQEPM